MAVVGGGAQAERAVVHESCALPVPDTLDWAGAGGFPEAFTTAHDAVFTQAGLAVGETLCVHGAAGGGGVAAVQPGGATGAHAAAPARNPDPRTRPKLRATVVAPERFAAHGPFTCSS